MDLLRHKHLLRTLALVLGSTFGGLSSGAFAQSANPDVDRLRSLASDVYAEGRARYDFVSRRAFRGKPEVTCESLEETSLNKSGVTTTAGERYEAALAFSQCVEDRKAMLFGKYGAELTRLGGPMFAEEVVHQATKVDSEGAKLGIRKASSENDFMNMGFGIGVGVSYSSKEQIRTATVNPDGTVLVTERHKQLPRVILEAHYYGACQKRLDACSDGAFGVGPFFGVAATGDTLEAFALGIMFGWKQKYPASDSGGGFSIGIGAVLDKDFKELAPGWVEGEAAPGGQTTVPLVTRSRWSPLLFFTKTF